MNATAETTALHDALIEECDTELRIALAPLLEVGRVLSHALQCGDCRRYVSSIAGIFAGQARDIGALIHGWRSLDVSLDDVLQPRPDEITSLLEACRDGVEQSENGDFEFEWGGLAVTLGPSSALE